MRRWFRTLAVILMCLIMPLVSLASSDAMLDAQADIDSAHTIAVGRYVKATLALDSAIRTCAIRSQRNDPLLLEDFSTLIDDIVASGHALLKIDSYTTRSVLEQSLGAMTDQEWSSYQTVYDSATGSFDSALEILQQAIVLARSSDNADFDGTTLLASSAAIRESLLQSLQFNGF